MSPKLRLGTPSLTPPQSLDEQLIRLARGLSLLITACSTAHERGLCPGEVKRRREEVLYVYGRAAERT